eukprot:Hpha_TRINITY_DN15085_c1_g2::TRINITY_DN15085_c1_g2_i1::g.123554::m.123554
MDALAGMAAAAQRESIATASDLEGDSGSSLSSPEGSASGSGTSSQDSTKSGGIKHSPKEPAPTSPDPAPTSDLAQTSPGSVAEQRAVSTVMIEPEQREPSAQSAPLNPTMPPQPTGEHQQQSVSPPLAYPAAYHGRRASKTGEGTERRTSDAVTESELVPPLEQMESQAFMSGEERGLPGGWCPAAGTPATVAVSEPAAESAESVNLGIATVVFSALVAARRAAVVLSVTASAVAEDARTRTWISYEVFLRLERDWAALESCLDPRGACARGAVVGMTIGGWELTERDADKMDKNGNNTGMVSLADMMREFFPNVSKWDLRRFFLSDLPGEQLLALKGSLGSQSPGGAVTYLPKDARWWTCTFDQLTMFTSSKLTLEGLKQAGENLGNMRFPISLFEETAERCDVAPERFRATFWELLETLFPRVPQAVIRRYGAGFIPVEDVEPFEKLFRAVRPADPRAITYDEFRLYLRQRGENDKGVRYGQLENGIKCDLRAFSHIDRDRNGKVTLYELLQHFYPNVAPPLVKKAIAMRNAVWKTNLEHEDDSIRKTKIRLPVIQYFENRHREDNRSPQAAVDGTGARQMKDTKEETESDDPPDSSSWRKLGITWAHPVGGMIPLLDGALTPVPPGRKRSASCDTMSEGSVEREEDAFGQEKFQAPSSQLLRLIYPPRPPPNRPKVEIEGPLRLTQSVRKPPDLGRDKKQESSPPRDRKQGASPKDKRLRVKKEEQRETSPPEPPFELEDDATPTTVGQVAAEVGHGKPVANEDTPIWGQDELPRLAATAPGGKRGSSNGAVGQKPTTAPGATKRSDSRVSNRLPNMTATIPGQVGTFALMAPSLWEAGGEDDILSPIPNEQSKKQREKEERKADRALAAARGVSHPLGKKAEEMCWYRWGVQQRPEQRRTERRPFNIGGNMTSVKTWKVAELLNYENSEVWVMTANGRDITAHCPNVVAVLDDADKARSRKTKPARALQRKKKSKVRMKAGPSAYDLGGTPGNGGSPLAASPFSLKKGRPNRRGHKDGISRETSRECTPDMDASAKAVRFEQSQTDREGVSLTPRPSHMEADRPYDQDLGRIGAGRLPPGVMSPTSGGKGTSPKGTSPRSGQGDLPRPPHSPPPRAGSKRRRPPPKMRRGSGLQERRSANQLSVEVGSPRAPKPASKLSQRPAPRPLPKGKPVPKSEPRLPATKQTGTSRPPAGSGAKQRPGKVVKEQDEDTDLPEIQPHDTVPSAAPARGTVGEWAW